MTQKVTIAELKDFNNIEAIDSLSDAQRNEWYQHIKQCLPKLKTFYPAERFNVLVKAISDYEKRHNIV
jgi:hypothetical protein